VPLHYLLQEAQLPQRNSASAAHVYLGWLTDRAMHRHHKIADVVQLGYSHIVSVGHSRSFKVILIGVSRNPERIVDILYYSVDIIFETYQGIVSGKLQIRRF